jgi:hypothetical protein
MSLKTEPYAEQARRWPRSGRHLLAQFDAESVVVYQAYRPSIGRFAAENGYLGGDFSYTRMSWIKTNFLWMMYRSGWGTKKDQEITLGLRIRRTFFDELLSQAVESTWDRNRYPVEKEWQSAVARSNVRLQWDPDHNPGGGKLARRAIQLGLRGVALERFGREQLLEVLDLSEFVAEQRARLQAGRLTDLITPREQVYLPADPAIAASLGLSG